MPRRALPGLAAPDQAAPRRALPHLAWPRLALSAHRRWIVWPSPYFGHLRLAQRPRIHFVSAGTVAIQPPHCAQRASFGGGFVGAGAGSRHD